MKAAFAENDTADVVKNELYACESQLLVYQGRKEVGGMDVPELHTAGTAPSYIKKQRHQIFTFRLITAPYGSRSHRAELHEVWKCSSVRCGQRPESAA
jgi:hypothetical protein